MTTKISRWGVRQGAGFKRYISLPIAGTDPKQYTDLSGIAFYGHVRAKAGATGMPEATMTFTLADHPSTGDANGAVLVTIPGSVTAAMKAGTHSFDVYMVVPGDEPDDVKAGEFYVKPRTTIIP